MYNWDLGEALYKKYITEDKEEEAAKQLEQKKKALLTQYFNPEENIEDEEVMTKKIVYNQEWSLYDQRIN